MDPYDFEPFNNPMLREMERLNRLTDEMNWIDRQINPLKHTASMLSPLERIADEVNSLERIAREINPAEHLIAAQDAVSKCIREAAMPLPDFTLPQITPEESACWINELRFPIDRIETRLSDFEFPELPESRTPAELEAMSDTEIADFLGGNVSITTTMLAVRELTRRQLNQVTRPHWTVPGTFWSSVIIGAIGIAIGAITVYLMMHR